MIFERRQSRTDLEAVKFLKKDLESIQSAITLAREKYSDDHPVTAGDWFLNNGEIISDENLSSDTRNKTVYQAQKTQTLGEYFNDINERIETQPAVETEILEKLENVRSRARDMAKERLRNKRNLIPR